jgi:dTDP-4-dehydrorhamnose reductase
MRLLVTGAGGMLGRDVTRAGERAGHAVSALARADLDITDPVAVRRTLAGERPTAVINCAAWTDVDGAEAEPETAHAVNSDAVGDLGAAACEAGARVVHVSSDYVFDGRGREPYLESSPTRPVSVYGRTKLGGEQALALSGAGHVIVRSSWLFGTGGGNFVDTMLRLAAERGEVAVVTDQVGCPTWTGHLGPALVELAAGPAMGIAHVAGAGQCSWHDFALEIFRRAGVECEVRPATSAEMARPAPRPPYSVLGTERGDVPRLPAWQAGLEGFLAERAAAAGAAT